MLAVLFSLFVASQTNTQGPSARRADSRAWYQAYSDGRRAIQQGNWQAAIDSLEVAKRAGAPKPGRKIPFYGDVYDDFIPDYYLGIAYLNLKQYAEADRAFAAVRASGLIGPRDREYAQFETQANAARSGALQAQTVAQNAPTPTGAGAAGAGAGAASAVNPSPAAPSPPASQQPTSPTIAAPSSVVQQSPVQTTPLPGAGTQSALPGSKGPGTSARNTAANGVASRPVAPTPTNPPTAPGLSAAADEQAGIAAYLSGQYDRASSLLTAAAPATGATARAYFYLACSRTALAITVGQADAAAVAAARATLARAGDPAQFAADRRYISPRILQALGLNP
jgi:hypothetical protein